MVNGKAIRDVIIDIFVSKPPDSKASIRKFVRMLAKNRHVDYLEALENRGFKINQWVLDTTFPEIPFNPAMDKIISANIRNRFEDNGQFQDFAGFARYYLLKRNYREYNWESIEIEDIILVSIYEYALRANLDVALLYAQHGYMLNADPLTELLQNPEFYSRLSIYKQLIDCGATFNGLGNLTPLYNNPAIKQLTLTPDSFHFIYDIITVAMKRRSFKNMPNFLVKMLKDAFITQSWMVKPMIMAGVPYDDDFTQYPADVNTLTPGQIAYYNDISQFIADYENKYLPSLFQYYDLESKEKIKDIFITLYLRTELPPEIINLIAAYSA